MNKIVIPAGYMGSGSSAITDLLSEIDGFHENNGDFEYILLHSPDGVFDLEDKLLFGNTTIRSDEAIYRFRRLMKTLYNQKNYWVGSYNKKISTNFIKYADDFIASLVTASFDDLYWYFPQNPDTIQMQIQHYIRRFVRKATFGKITLDMPLKYKEMTFAFPTEETFYSSAKLFLEKIFMDLGYEEHNLVLDQFLLPHNLFRINRYFGDEIKVIVVDRDPRDVFVLNKYKWAPDKNAIPYPLNVSNFIKFYSEMRKSENVINDPRILRLHFEDLVYEYDRTCDKIYEFLEINASYHTSKKRNFNPEISIKNTQLYNIDSKIKKECLQIEEKLPEYIYNFTENKKNKKLIYTF